jgi:LmbE family N-acetylglucosaminyl deacetylase
MVLVLSPHLDDGIFSCGQLLQRHPGSFVATALAGLPSIDDPLGAWDRETGFSSSHAAVLARRDEDEAACAVVRATPIWLGGLDGGQYELPVKHDDLLREQILDLVRARSDEELFVPLGIYHADHQKVARLGRIAAQALGRTFVVYEELPYRVDYPEAWAAARAVLVEEGWDVAPVAREGGSLEVKNVAIDCYVSQAQHFARSSLVAEERFLAVANKSDRAL